MTSAEIMKAIDAMQRLTVLSVIRLLEAGDVLGECPPALHLRDEDRERLRVLRAQLCERDLYELLYGELPTMAVNPDAKCDPWEPAVAV